MLTLADIPKKSRIFCNCSDGSEYIIFDHLDGIYSYCETEKGGIVHISRRAPLKKVGDYYEIWEGDIDES